MSMTETTDRSIGSDMPAAGTYEIDPAHTYVGFAVKHFGLSRTRGEFATLSGTVTIAQDITASRTEVEIVAASFATGDEARDAHVRSADFLDVEKFSQLTFRSERLEQRDGAWVLHGDLTVKDTTRTVELAVEFEGETVDPYGNARIAFSASTRIDRTDFGLTWNQALETGGLVVGKRVDITLEVEAIRPVAG